MSSHINTDSNSISEYLHSDVDNDRYNLEDNEGDKERKKYSTDVHRGIRTQYSYIEAVDVAKASKAWVSHSKHSANQKEVLFGECVCIRLEETSL